MNQRPLFFLFLVMACIAITTPAMGGSTLSFVSDTLYPLPYADGPAFDITAEGNLAWLMVNENQKASANVIATQVGTHLPTTAPGVHDYATTPDAANYPPAFSYTDGQDPTSATYHRSDIALAGVATDFYLPAGSGSLAFWWVYVPVDEGGSQFTLEFDGGASYTVPLIPFAEKELPRKTVIYWENDTAQTLHLTSLGTAGFNAIAVSQVPEPGTLALLTSGVFGLIAYAWRKRK